MKGIVAAAALALGFASCAVAEDTGWQYTYSSLKHNIRVSCPDVGSVQCTYECWNKPRQVGQGKPDLALEDGRHILYPNGNSLYRFTTGNVRIEVFDSLRHDEDDSLDVYISGRRKNHYRLTAF